MMSWKSRRLRISGRPSTSVVLTVAPCLAAHGKGTGMGLRLSVFFLVAMTLSGGCEDKSTPNGRKDGSSKPSSFAATSPAAARTARPPEVNPMPHINSTVPVPPSIASPDPSPSSVTVYITRTGTKYHRAGCRYLSKSAIPISLEQAKARYSPCSVCRPPT